MKKDKDLENPSRRLRCNRTLHLHICLEGPQHPRRQTATNRRSWRRHDTSDTTRLRHKRHKRHTRHPLASLLGMPGWDGWWIQGILMDPEARIPEISESLSHVVTLCHKCSQMFTNVHQFMISLWSVHDQFMISSWSVHDGFTWIILNLFGSAVCIEADAMSRWSHPRPKYQFLGHTWRQLVTISWHILTSTTTRYDTIRHVDRFYFGLTLLVVSSLEPSRSPIPWRVWHGEAASSSIFGSPARSSFLFISHHFSSYWCQKVRCKVDPSI